MWRKTSFRISVAVFIVILKVQGIDMVNTRDQQCKLRGYDTACSDNTDSCIDLKCGRLMLDHHYVAYTIIYGVGEGTKCGEGKICSNRLCINARGMMPVYVGYEKFNECRPAQPIAVARTRSDQCIRYGYNGACKNYSKYCHILYCAKQGTRGHVFTKVVPRWGVDMGTKCGENKICVNNQCVDVVGDMPVQLGMETELSCRTPTKPGFYEPVLTRDEQCKKHGFDVACSFAETTINNRCKYLRCGYETISGRYMLQIVLFGETPSSVINPTSGSRCGELRTCYKNRCVDTLPHPMAHYTGEETFKGCYTPQGFETTKCD